MIGPNALANGIKAWAPPDGVRRIYSGSWVTPVDEGEIVVKLQVKRLDTNGNSFSTHLSSMTWTLVVYPDIPSNVPAIGDVGLAVMVLGLLAAAGYIVARRQRQVA